MKEVSIVVTCNKDQFYMVRRGLTQRLNFTESVQQGVVIFEVDDSSPLKPYGRPGKLSVSDKNEIASKHFNDHISYCKLAEMYGVSASSIKRVCDSLKLAYRK